MSFTGLPGEKWFSLWKTQLRDAAQHIWNGDVEAGVSLLEKIVSEMKAYQATQRGGTA